MSDMKKVHHKQMQMEIPGVNCLDDVAYDVEFAEPSFVYAKAAGTVSIVAAGNEGTGVFTMSAPGWVGDTLAIKVNSEDTDVPEADLVRGWRE